jgi:hypothetical protein
VAGGGFRIETTVTQPFQKQNSYKFIMMVTGACNGHSPTDANVRSGAAAAWWPWPLTKANSFILEMDY